MAHDAPVATVSAGVIASPPPAADWRTAPLDDLFARLGASPHGLTAQEAAERLSRDGPNELSRTHRVTVLREFLELFLNPLVLILLVAAAISAALGEPVNAVVILVIIALNVVLNFVQAYRSQLAVEALRRRVSLDATVVRDGAAREIAQRDVVAGDVVQVRAGDVMPADGRVLDERDLYVNEAALTGESLPVEKAPGDPVFLGSSVMSGSATLLAVRTGPRTEFGEIAARLAARAPESEFERGIRRFAYLITRVVILLVLFVFLVNILLKRDLLESFLFAVALAIGLTPELLPMITSVTLAHGAVRMARKKVLVKRLPAIQNMGSMDVLCSDKTGTLTEGAIQVERSIGPDGAEDPAALHYGALNSAWQSGVASPLDAAILAAAPDAAQGTTKIDEIPFDHLRRRLTVVVETADPPTRLLITKGAPESVLPACAAVQLGGQTRPLDDVVRPAIEAVFLALSRDGYRALGVAIKQVAAAPRYDATDEEGLTFVGFLVFRDPPKLDAGEAIAALQADGVRVLILTGDNELVTAAACRAISLPATGIVLGSTLDGLDDLALAALAERTTIFARVSPEQKNRVIRALQSRGHVVGFLGDGVNDAPSLHSADVGISVDSAADVAKEAADIILLQHDLKVLHDGVREGRESFGNVMKYVLMGMSSNFGNMLSMAGATAFLPFLPMLPIQVLINNLLYDTSQVTLPVDRVDAAFVRKPKHWDVSFIQRFMVVFGPVSSLFDFLTFFAMLKVFDASEPLFHTGWFVESLATQTLVIYVIRTTGNPLKSRPSGALIATTLACVAVGIFLPFSPLADTLGFQRPPADFFLFLLGVVVAYLLLAQAVKVWFYRRTSFGG